MNLDDMQHETGRNDILGDLMAARINVQETVNTERFRSPSVGDQATTPEAERGQNQKGK